MTVRHGVRAVFFIAVVSTAILIRLSVAASDIPLLGDAKTRYHPIAGNLLAGNGFSRDTAPPYRPDSFDQPGYPLLLASIYSVTNSSRRAVVWFQLFLELLVLLPVVWIARELKMPRGTQMLAVVIGLVTPFLAKYAGLILSEVPATLVLCLTCFAFMRSVHESRNNRLIWWALAGLTSGVSLLIRADSLIVLALMSAVAIILARPPSMKWRLIQPSVLIVCVLLILAPWTIRNYIRFSACRPLGGVAAQTGQPYVKWLNTWFDDPADLKTFWWEAMKEDASPPPFPEGKGPDSEERIRALKALLQAREQKTMIGEPAREFRDLTAEARRKRPLQAFAIVPVKRVIKTWVYPQINRVPTLMSTRLPFFLVNGLWLVLSAFTIIGIANALRLKRYSVLLLVAVIVGRAFLPFISSLGADPRLLVETLPAIYVLSACGMKSVLPRGGAS